MGLTQKQLNEILKASANASADQLKGFQDRGHSAQQNQLQRDAALSQLIRGKELEEEVGNRNYQRDLETAKALREQYGNETSVDAGQVRLGAYDPLMALLRKRELDQPKLTPAQETSEKTAAKKIADWEAAGGKTTARQQLDSVRSVKEELKGGKRDYYDRVVGGLTSGMPVVMGAVAPSEKGRRDRAYSAASTRLKQLGDPNPTETRIRETMGQIYDPSSDDATNEIRLSEFERQIEETNKEMERSADNLARTGYIMPGLAGSGELSGGRPSGPSPFGDDEPEDSVVDSRVQQTIDENATARPPVETPRQKRIRELKQALGK